jgi:hypothetical protein
MPRLTPILRLAGVVALAVAPLARADSAKLFLFQSAATRAEEGVARQKAREALALAAYGRAYDLFQRGFLSAEEFETNDAALKVARLDRRIAETRARAAAITLTLARALDRAGKALPVCKRKPAKDEDTVSKLLKKPTKDEWKPAALSDLMGGRSGTRLTPREDPPDPPPPGGEPGGAPGGNPGGRPGGEPGGRPGGTPGGFPGGTPGGAPGGTPGGAPGGDPGDIGGDPGGGVPGGGSPGGGVPGGGVPGGGSPGGNAGGSPGGNAGGSPGGDAGGNPGGSPGG